MWRFDIPACGLTFLALVLSLFMLSSSTPRFGTRVCSGTTLAASILATLLTTLIFLFDVIFVAVVRNRLNDELDGQVKATWGTGVRIDFLFGVASPVAKELL